MLLFRRLYSSSSAAALNKMRVIHLAPSNVVDNKFGKYKYFAHSPTPTGDPSDNLRGALFTPAKGSLYYDEHKIAKENVKKKIDAILKYAAKYVRNTGKDPLMVHISTPECFFYLERGGYSEEDMTEFLDHIRKIVVNLPEGLHFNLGTFPFIVDRVPLPNTVFDKLYGNGRFIQNITESLNIQELNFLNEINSFFPKLQNFLLNIKPGEMFDFTEFSRLHLRGKVERALVRSVENINPFLLNMAICGESGKNGSVNIYSKMVTLSTDPFYTRSVHLKANDIRLIKSITLLGDTFYKIYEICYNHGYGVAEINEALMKLRVTPEQYAAFHEIISASINLNFSNTVAETVSHNDVRPLKDRVSVSKNGEVLYHENITPNPFLFEKTPWIRSCLFEYEVSVERLKALKAPTPSESRNRNSVH